MAAYVDFTFYDATYLGVAIAEDDFPRIALRASEIIDRITFNRAASDTDNETAIKMANCAVCDVFYEIEQGNGSDAIESERIGSNAVSYGENSSKRMTASQQYENAARLYLDNTPLMYQGFAEDEYGSVVAF